MSDTSDETEIEEHEVVRVNGCDIYYYGDVETESTLEFLDQFKKLEVDLLKRQLNYPVIVLLSACIYTVMAVTFFPV